MPVSQPTRRRVRTSLKRVDVEKLIRSLPAMLSGRIPSKFGLHKLFWGAVAYSLFKDIFYAYAVKSVGQTDELGDSWQDISQHTKAYKRPLARHEIPDQLYRRLKRNAPARMKGSGKFAHDPTRAQTGLGLLSSAEYARWRRIFGTTYYSQRTKIGDRAAKALAGQLAWTQLKASGASTMWEVLGNRDLLILRKSDRLMTSLSPGKFDPNSGYRKSGPDQVFVLSRGKIELGTQVEYADVVSQVRPIWPDEIDLWLNRAVDYARDVVMDKIANVLQTSLSL